RQIHELSDDDLIVRNRRTLGDLVHAEDYDFRVVQYRRREHTAERAQAGDGEGGAGEILARGLARLGHGGQAIDVAGDVDDRLAIGVAHHRDDEAVRGRGGEADVILPALHDLARGLVEERVHLGKTAQRLDRGLH